MLEVDMESGLACGGLVINMIVVAIRARFAVNI